MRTFYFLLSFGRLRIQLSKQAKFIKYRGMFEVNSPENNNKIGKRIGLNNWNIIMQVENRTRLGVRGVSVPCRHGTPVADALLGEMSDSVIMLSPVIMSQTVKMSNRYRMSLV